MAPIDSQVLVALISTLGGVVITYLTVKYKDVLVRRNRASNAQDRMETIFDGYESLIKQQQLDINRKSTLIEHLQNIIDSQRDEIEKSQGLINSLRDELKQSGVKTQQLQEHLQTIKKDYQATLPTNESGV